MVTITTLYIYIYQGEKVQDKEIEEQTKISFTSLKAPGAGALAQRLHKVFNPTNRIPLS